jgi:hypothetical protein
VELTPFNFHCFNYPKLNRSFRRKPEGYKAKDKTPTFKNIRSRSPVKKIKHQMDTMLQDILINTYNPDPVARKQAEAALEQYLHNSGAFYSLLEFTKTQEMGRDLRLAASIVTKNKARSYWRTDEDVLPISSEEKETCKVLLLDILLVETDTAIRGMLAETVRTIAEFDFPDRYALHATATHHQYLHATF